MLRVGLVGAGVIASAKVRLAASVLISSAFMARGVSTVTTFSRTWANVVLKCSRVVALILVIA